MTNEERQTVIDALELWGTDDVNQADWENCKKALAIMRREREPVAWQFRWTNPANKADARPYELEWQEVVQTNSNHTIEDAITDLLGYRFDDKPCYEVRPLYKD